LTLPEDSRQEYLQALGIDSYFPRRSLPGAPESRQCEWPENWQVLEEPAQETSTQQNGAAPESEPVPEMQSPVNQETQKTTGMPPTHEKEELDEDTPAHGEVKVIAGEECRLKLACIKVNPSLAIINVMPHMGQGQLQVQHRHLLANALKATGILADDIAMDDKPFQWPMMQGEHSDNSRAAAAAALTGYLQQKFSDWQFNTLLIMGEQAIVHIFEEDDGDSENPASLEGHGWSCVYTRSLDEIFHNPLLKKELRAVLKNIKI